MTAFSIPDISDWLHLLKLRIPTSLGSSYTQPSVETGLAPPTSQSFQGLQLSVGLTSVYERSLRFLKSPNLLRSVTLTSRDDLASPNLCGQISSSPGPFGRGLLLSDMGGTAIVTLVEDAAGKDVVTSVLSSVLNGSMLLAPSHAGLEEYFFLKEEERNMAADYQELQRLSGSFNISKDSLRPYGRQICVTSASASRSSTRTKICLIYGMERRISTRHVYRSAHKAAVEKAWKDQLMRLRSGQFDDGEGPFSQSQKNELMKKGYVKGFQALEIQNVHKTPALLGQSSNILIAKDSFVRENQLFTNMNSPSNRRMGGRGGRRGKRGENV